MAVWSEGYPVNFAVDGDKTSEAIEKFMYEFEKVYPLLNRLRKLDGGEVAPTDPETYALWLDTSGDTTVLKVYSGVAWVNVITMDTITGLNDKFDLYVLISNVINTLVSTETDKPLSANMGKSLKDTADTLATLVDTKVNATDYATDSIGGVVKVGAGLSILAGVLSADILGDDTVTTSMIQNEAVTPVKFPKYTAGTDLLIKAIETKSTSELTVEKVKEIQVLKAGTLTTKFTLRVSGNQAGVYGQIYKNGSPEGTLRSTSSSGYVTFTEDVTLNAGDLIQLYIKVGDELDTAYTDLLGLYITNGIETSVVIEG